MRCRASNATLSSASRVRLKVLPTTGRPGSFGSARMTGAGGGVTVGSGSGVGVEEGVGVGVGVRDAVGTGVAEGSALGARAGTGVAVGVGVAVGTGVGVGVGVAVGTGVGVGVGVGVAVGSGEDGSGSDGRRWGGLLEFPPGLLLVVTISGASGMCTTSALDTAITASSAFSSFIT